MSLQWATRAGVLRHLRLGNAFSRPTRVISMQNQLRSVCLVPKPSLTKPHAGSLSALVSQQSQSFATTADAPKAKRGRKPGSSKRKSTSAAKPTSKKKKKPLTENQKAAKEKRERRAKINTLKATALDPPKKLPTRPWQIALAARFHEVKQQFQSPTDTLKEVVSILKTMSPEEFEPYKTQAEENRASNEAAMKTWLESHTPAQIRDANQARLQLNRLQKKRVRPIKDERLVKRPLSAFFIFMKERLASGDFKHLTGREVTPRISAEWKNMTETEKQRYVDSQARERQRYEREHLEVYGEPPKTAPRDNSPNVSEL